jgi:hypothetical protein
MPLTPHGLYAPASYLDADPALLANVCNGCGSARAKFDFVPDTLWGLNINAACQIHDWMYHCGETAGDKLEADVVLLANMMRLIEGAGGIAGFVLVHLRRWRAFHYYALVRAFGDPSFFEGKTASLPRGWWLRELLIAIAALALRLALLGGGVAWAEPPTATAAELRAEALRREAALLEEGDLCATQRCIILSRVRKQLALTEYQPPACVEIHSGRICVVHSPAPAPDGR